MRYRDSNNSSNNNNNDDDDNNKYNEYNEYNDAYNYEGGDEYEYEYGDENSSSNSNSNSNVTNSGKSLEDFYLYHGVYLFKGIYEYLYVCDTCSREGLIGKLVQYRKQTPTMYEKTNIAYFLNCYKEDDIKSLFLSRDNYELIGVIGKNFKLSEDKDQSYLIKV